MTDLDTGKTVSLQELMVSTLAMVDAVTKLLIEKGVISEEEFREKLMEERATYQKDSLILRSNETSFNTDLGIVPSMVHLPKPPSQFKNLFWNFRVVNLVVFPR
jgi:hypothetical protein